jgi:chemotaxis protein MotB
MNANVFRGSIEEDLMQPGISVLALALLAGCVSQSKYDSLKTKYDLAQTQLGERQRRIGSLGASIDDAKAQVEKLRRENERTQTQLTALQTERAQLETEQRRMTMEMTDLLEDRARLRTTGDRLRVALTELAARKLEADRRVAEFKGLLLRFKTLIDAGTLKVAINDGRMVLQMPTDVLFDSGSAKLSKLGRDAVREVTQGLKDVANRRYQIEGHTDNVPIHTSQYASNWELAAARGLGVVRAMAEAGMDPGLLSAASYGEFHPAKSNDTAEGQRANRRIEIILVPDLAMLPGNDELQLIVQGP